MPYVFRSNERGPLPDAFSLLRLGGVLALFVASHCLAFESNEHREIGNCAVGIAARMVEGGLADDQAREAWLPQMRKLLPKLVPGAAPCEIPAHTNGFIDWSTKLIGREPNLEPDERGRQIWTAGSPPGVYVTYGYLAALVDSYLFPDRLLEQESCLHPSLLDPTKPPQIIESLQGRLPWPEDARAVSANDSHFRGLAVLQFKRHHDRARHCAGSGNVYWALVNNAIADHYLLDLFAPGHVMSARQTIPEELALAMHDSANETGAFFSVTETEYLSIVIEFMHSRFTDLFLAADGRRTSATLDALKRELESWSDWLPLPRHRRADGYRMPAPLLFRGDNYLTDRKMDPQKSAMSIASLRQYILVVAAQTLSIIDVLRQTPSGASLCKREELCRELDKGFVNAEWFGPKVEVTGQPEPRSRIRTPAVRICCGQYDHTKVHNNLYQLSTLRNTAARDEFGDPAPMPDAAGDYRYLSADWIWGLNFEREYSRRTGGATPRTFSLSWTPSFASYSGEVLEFPQSASSSAGDVSRPYFASGWFLASYSVRFGLTDDFQLRHYGVELRGMTNLQSTPWRYGIYGRLGRYQEGGDGPWRDDNGVGLVFEPFRSTFFRFAVVLGTRGFPIGSEENRYYGFEVGVFLPSSRLPLIGDK
jgi:hypothetical protein